MLVKVEKKRIDKKSILIFGITGQDGSLLAKHYIDKNFIVYGVVTSKKFSPRNLNKLNYVHLYKGRNIKVSNLENEPAHLDGEPFVVDGNLNINVKSNQIRVVI